jgi:hypothetical protein
MIVAKEDAVESLFLSDQVSWRMFRIRVYVKAVGRSALPI